MMSPRRRQRRSTLTITMLIALIIATTTASSHYSSSQYASAAEYTSAETEGAMFSAGDADSQFADSDELEGTSSMFAELKAKRAADTAHASLASAESSSTGGAHAAHVEAQHSGHQQALCGEKLLISSCDASPGPYRIRTSGAHAWESFVMHNTTYLAVANYGDDDTVEVNSVIYRWNALAMQFDVFQQIPTKGAAFIEYFTIHASSYLMIAQFSDGESYDLASPLFKFDTAQQLFVVHQLIPTQGGYNVATFALGSNIFMAIANEFDGEDFNTQSEILKYDPAQDKFVAFQSIATHGVFAFEPFILDSATYLAIANDRNGSTFCIDSEIMKYDAKANKFVPFQHIATHGCTHLKPFVINNEQYLAAANFGNGAAHKVTSEIFKFDRLESKFVSYQMIPTSGAMSIEIFAINAETYMFVANNFGGISHNTKSEVFKWDIATSKFVSFQQIPTNSAQYGHFFTIGGDSYLAIANEYDDTTYTLDSLILKWCSGKFVLTQ